MFQIKNSNRITGPTKGTRTDLKKKICKLFITFLQYHRLLSMKHTYAVSLPSKMKPFVGLGALSVRETPPLIKNKICANFFLVKMI